MIELNNLSKSYKGKLALDNICLTINDGRIKALMGANGAGKTTLINILSGFLKPDHGTVLINGKIGSPHSFKNFGFVFESPIYIEKLSAKEYLLFVGNLYGLPQPSLTKRIHELLQLLSLPHDNNKYIEDYSKGMKAKVSIAAAVLHQPSALILDEPFDGIDFLSTQIIVRMLKDISSRGGIIFIASHQFELVKDFADEIAVLKRGKLELDLPVEKFKELSSSFHSESLFLENILSN